MYKSSIQSYRPRGKAQTTLQSQVVTPTVPHSSIKIPSVLSPSVLTPSYSTSTLTSPYANTSSIIAPTSSTSTSYLLSPQITPLTPLHTSNIYPLGNVISLGLINLGNTCFMSSVLQVLFDLLSFKVYLHDKKEVTEAYMQLLNTHSDQDYERFKKEAGKKISMIDDYDQQDAHEFLCQILQVFNRENQEVKYFSKVNFTINPSQNVFANWENYCKQMEKSDNSLVTRLFGGEIYTQLKCPSSHTNYLFERVLNLSLAFPDDPQLNHIQDLLTQNFEPETINDVTCQKCSTRVEMIKKSYIYNLPKVLILHLKRFKLGYFSNSKIRTGVLFDEILTIKPQILHPDTQTNTHSYRLFAVVHHTGGLNGGHYFTQKRIGNKWYLFNDKCVSQANMSEMRNRSETAYMLFYGRL